MASRFLEGGLLADFGLFEDAFAGAFVSRDGRSVRGGGAFLFWAVSCFLYPGTREAYRCSTDSFLFLTSPSRRLLVAGC